MHLVIKQFSLISNSLYILPEGYNNKQPLVIVLYN